MADKEGPIKVTLTLDDARLYRAVRHLAIEQGRPVRAVVAEALEQWVEAREEEQDLRAMAEAEGDELVPWEEVEHALDAAEAATNAG